MQMKRAKARGRRAIGGADRGGHAIGVLLVLLLLGGGLLLPTGNVHAGEEEAAPGEASSAALDPKEYKSRLAKLRTVASRWIVARVEFPSRCPLCQGAGKTRVRAGHKVVTRDCNQCGGHRAWISPKHYRKVYYDMRTPAFQALPGIKDTLGAQYKLASAGKPWPTLVKRYRIRERVMVDDTHGIVYFLFNASKVPIETRWIWAEISGKEGSKKKFQWYAYDERSDGAWPQAATTSGATRGPVEGSGWQELTRGESREVRRAIARARISFRAEGYFKKGESLRVHLAPWARSYKRSLTERVTEDAVRLSRAVLESTQAFDRVESQWSSEWQDPYGQVHVHPTWVVSLDRRTHKDALWSTRSPLERAGLLTWTEVQRKGWTPLEREPVLPRSPEPAPALPEESVPEPSPPEPGVPEPSPEAPALPTPQPLRPEPTRPAPPPMPTPPPIEETSWDLPEPSASQLKKGRAGIEQMEALFTEAVRAHDEGVEARRSGSHDLWQEKLSEASAAMAEMDAVWLEEVVPAMPGDNEGEQEEIANEAFGEIWEKVDKLRSMVRKMSAMR